MATRKPARRAPVRPKARPRPTAKKRTAPKKAARRAPARAQSSARAAAPKPGHERRRSDPQTLRLRAIEPSLTVDDLKASLRFYTEVLGFIEGERWEDNGVLRGVMLKAGACSIGLSQDDWSKGRDRQKGVGFRIWCTTAQDVDLLAERIQAAGGRITEGPTTPDWGGRSLTVDDPDGYHLSIYREA
jgi:predicted enzyme related to lactoylglutathione lyase